jgi:hypothetical protein
MHVFAKQESCRMLRDTQRVELQLWDHGWGAVCA